MKKQLLAKIAGIAGAVALLTGATFAYFTSNRVTIKNVTLASATPSLKIYSPANHDYRDIAWGLVISESNMYPGWVGKEHKFYLKNMTGGDVPFARIFPSVLVVGSDDWQALKDVVRMRFAETGKTWGSGTGWRTLKWWYTTHTANMLLSDLSDEGKRQFSVQFQMLSGGDQSNAQSRKLDFDLSFVARTP